MLCNFFRLLHRLHAVGSFTLVVELSNRMFYENRRSSRKLIAIAVCCIRFYNLHIVKRNWHKVISQELRDGAYA